MSITEHNPETEDALSFAIDMAELEMIADRVIEAGPRADTIHWTDHRAADEVAFVDWWERYQALLSAADGLCTHIPPVDVFEGFREDFHAWWEAA